eukprot:2808501-Pleurochrysis_carterae.AAC.7
MLSHEELLRRDGLLRPNLYERHALVGQEEDVVRCGIEPVARLPKAVIASRPGRRGPMPVVGRPLQTERSEAPSRHHMARGGFHEDSTSSKLGIVNFFNFSSTEAALIYRY